MGVPIGTGLSAGVYHPENKTTSGQPKPPAAPSQAQALAEHLAQINSTTPQSYLPTPQAQENDPVYGFENGGQGRNIMFQPGQFQGLGGAFDSYLRRKKSPLAGRGNMFVNVARNAGIDPRLLLAIAGTETSFMTDPNAAPPSEHNAWGMGPGIQYPSWRAGARATAQNLGQNYIREGLTTLQEIGSKYSPPESNPNWLPNTTKFYNELAQVRPGVQDIPKWGGAQQLIYDPKGSWFRGNKGITPGPYGGHETHIHAAFSNPRAMLKAYRVGTKHGLDFTENPYTGQVYPVHAGTSAQYGDTTGGSTPSWHYRTFPGTFGPDNKKLGEAWDINDPNPSGGWDLARMFDFLAPRMTGSPYFDYGTRGSGGATPYAITGQGTPQQVRAQNQQDAASADLIGSSVGSYAVTPQGRRKKKHSTIDDLINNLTNIQTGGGVYGA